MQIISWIISGILVIIGAIFSVLNAHSVKFNYIVGKTTLPLVLLLLLAFALGMLVSAIVCGVKIIKLKALHYKSTKLEKN